MKNSISLHILKNNMSFEQKSQTLNTFICRVEYCLDVTKVRVKACCRTLYMNFACKEFFRISGYI